jgi:hypothetical protein
LCRAGAEISQIANGRCHQSQAERTRGMT